LCSSAALWCGSFGICKLPACSIEQSSSRSLIRFAHLYWYAQRARSRLKPPERRLQARLPAPQDVQNFGRCKVRGNSARRGAPEVQPVFEERSLLPHPANADYERIAALGQIVPERIGQCAVGKEFHDHGRIPEQSSCIPQFTHDLRGAPFCRDRPDSLRQFQPLPHGRALHLRHVSSIQTCAATCPCTAL
jgi:hypothetical protein